MAEHQTDALHIVGNTALLHRLLRDVRDGHLGHAYILDGPPGSGKHTVARWLAAAIACENRPGRTVREEDTDQLGMFDTAPTPPRVIPPDAPLPCGDCLPCRKVWEGRCPDIHVIGRDGKATLGVDAVRFLRQDVLIAPVDLDTRIYVIEDAETMTAQAQNALLLTLEEPPPYVLFLLLCNGADALLETIRSRAPVLRLQPIPDAEVRAYLSAHGRTLPEEEMAAVLLRAGGCIGQAMTLSDAKAVAPIMKNREVCDAYLAACADGGADRILAVINQWGTKREAVCDLMAGVNLALRDLILLRAGEAVRLCWYTDREAALDLSARFTKRRLLALYDALGKARDTLDANGNVRLTLIRMVMDAGVL